jgi:hypothetical protein
MILFTNTNNSGDGKMSDDENSASGSFTYYAFDDQEELSYEQEYMSNMADLINELNLEGKIQPFTEASTILQDYMDAWILWKQYSEAGEGSAARYSYSDFLFNVVAKRAIFISANIQ